MNYRSTSIVVTVVTVIASALAVVLLLTEGMRENPFRLSTDEFFMLVISSVFLAISVGLLAFSLFHGKKVTVASQEQEAPAVGNVEHIPQYLEEPKAALKAEPKAAPEPSTDSAVAKEEEHLISRLLNGDERRLYQMIASSGGEMLQMDIVAKRIFSKAKVTRLLDKLEGRGLIVRERHGLTNKIKLMK